MLIKICGITSVKVAQATAEAGADLIGFVFAPSSRQVTPEKAAEMAKALPEKVQTVGVFVNETLETIETIVEKVGLDFVQLHGDESAQFARDISVPVIRAFSIDDVDDEILQTYPCRYYIIDSPGTTYRGGSGNIFKWERLFDRNIDYDQFFLAGGLSVDNIEEAITTVRPRGVDVSSGVETNGEKDIQKINDFIATVRKIDGQFKTY